MRTHLLLLTSILVGLLLASCQTRHHPADQPPSKLTFPAVYAAASQGQNRKISSGWLRDFRDPRMTALVKEALTHNHNLKAAAFRLRSAKQNTVIGRAPRLPELTTSAGASLLDGSGIPRSENYSLSLNARWEPDLWGRLRNLDLASQADFAASLADFRGARLSLAAITASAWCNLVTAEQQLTLAKKTVDSYLTALPVVERRYRANTLRAVDVQFARNNVANGERSLRIRKLDRDNAARNLEVLLGRYPSAAVASADRLPFLTTTVPVGLPAKLLERRPDLQAARAELFASAQRVAAARKNLLPSLQLTSSASNSDRALGRIFDPNFLLYSVASSLSQTIYRGGTLTAQAQATLENHRAELSTYTQIALDAFREVEAALAADFSLAEQKIFLQKEVEQSRLAEKRALNDITLGIDGASFLEYLEAQRRSEEAGIALIQLKNARLQNRIDLHLALGGDFHTD